MTDSVNSEIGNTKYVSEHTFAVHSSLMIAGNLRRQRVPHKSNVKTSENKKVNGKNHLILIQILTRSFHVLMFGKGCFNFFQLWRKVSYKKGCAPTFLTVRNLEAMRKLFLLNQEIRKKMCQCLLLSYTSPLWRILI